MALLFLLSLIMTSFTVFGEELHSALPPSSSSSYYPLYDPSSVLHPQTHSPLKPPPPHHRRHHHPPASAPAQPAKPPTHTPVFNTPPPSPIVNNLIPARTFVSVQGVVFVKPCKYFGIDTLLEATPLPGAIVKIQCNNTIYPLIQTAETDKNGYFLLKAPKTVSNYGAHKCNVVLVIAPNGQKPTNLNGGVTGSPLRFQNQEGAFMLYSVGPLAFECKP